MALAPTYSDYEAPSAGFDAATIVMALGGAFGVLVLLFAVTFVLSRFLFICAPSEILIFSGRKNRLADGTIESHLLR